MSGYLWKFYLQDDVASFRQVLEAASYTARAGTQKGHAGGQAGNVGLGISSPGSLEASPTLTVKGRKGVEPSPAVPMAGITLTRADINHRDSQGRTLLHLAASSTSENAFEFATLLLEHPLTDIYLQDTENGWTALHRAFYAGNISIAHSILARDSQDAFGRGAGTVPHQAGGLIKIKDREGNGPLDLFEMTLLETDGSRTLGQAARDSDSDRESVPDHSNMDEDTSKFRQIPYLDLNGDEVYTFGSNKNVTLGFGDEDDRQFPERIALKRPEHLYFRFYEEYIESRRTSQSLTSSLGDISKSGKWLDDLPSVIRNRPIRIQDVQMSKLHTAILTTDPESNLYICGHGAGGRIGIGDETTRFQFVCIEGGGLAHKKVAAVALGQNHTLAISSEGEIFSWGSNSFGQLGYAVPQSRKNEEPVQPVPRQIYGPLKREIIVGIAASRLHSVVHTPNFLFTFGKNEGQLGIIDSDARSTEIQELPRRVGASLFSVPIKSVTAIDRATACLLENHEVWVFANYGYARVPFPLEGFTNFFLQSSIWATKYDSSPNRIVKVVSGGDTICAMSNSGAVFTVAVSQPTAAAQSSTASTTNPRQIKGALSQPLWAWSNKKSHLAARDVDVDQNGSIILVTQAGSVWRRVKRAKIKDATAAGTGDYKPKDYKYSRVSGLTRAIAVRASGFGAYAAIREDCIKTRDIPVSEKTLAADIAKLSPMDFSKAGDPGRYMAHLRLPPSLIMPQSISREKMDEQIQKFILHEPRSGLDYDMWLRTNTSNVKVPIHSFVLAGRSKIIRHGLERFQDEGIFGLPDLLSTRKGNDNRTEITFHNLDVLTLIYLILCLYSEQAILYSVTPSLPIPGVKDTQRHRQAQRDLLKIANRLEMKQLATAIEKPLRTSKVDQDMEQAFQDPAFFAYANVLVELADDEVPVHGALVCQRCPFFEGLFKGRAGGQWLAGRRQTSEGPTNAVRIDLSHVESKVFAKVLQHIYADTGEELFDDVVAEDLDAFLDQVIEVLGAANELMLTRLSEVCQRVIGKYVTVRNVCQLANAVAPCAVTSFKKRSLEYICMNLEAVLQNGVLEDLDEDLYFELDEVARQLQMDCSWVSRTDRQLAELFARHPDLQHRIDLERQAKIDSIHLLNKYADVGARAPASFKAGSFHELAELPVQHKARRRSSKEIHPGSPSPVTAPLLNGKRSVNDLIFDMDEEDEDDELKPTTPSKTAVSKLQLVQDERTTPDRNNERSRQGLLGVQKTPTIGQGSLESEALRLSSLKLPRDPVRPWGASPLPSSKLGMKEIMEQASSSRTSSLSLGLSAASRPEQRPARSFKISQKERKKMQQVQGSDSLAAPSPAPLVPASSPGNAWQMFPSKSKPAAPSVQTGNVTPPTNRPQQLTMRQTVANPSSNSKDKATTTAPAPGRTVSGSADASSPAGPSTPARQRPSVPAQPSSSTPKQPVIQSIRHTPMPERPGPSGAFYALSDILTEQQAAKDAVHDAAAKRSLQDIQQEQEFQEWWDKESARVMAEEARKARQADGRGGGRRRGGRGGKKQNQKDKSKEEVAEGSENAVPTQSGPPKGPRNRRPRKGGDGGNSSAGPAGSAGPAVSASSTGKK